LLGVKSGIDDVESEMTQPAKVQEPSMEEILASIRRIIADDEAKPASPALESPAVAPVASKPPVVKESPPPVVPALAASAAVSPPVVSPIETAAPVTPNNQDDIDALLSGLDEATSEAEIRPPLPDGEVFELTDDMALPDSPPEPLQQPSFHKIDPEDDLEFTEMPVLGPVRRHPEPPPVENATAAPQPQMLSRSTVSAVESAFNTLANTVLSNNARTLEDLVKEMLRPMLKSWLDDNLPGLVERIVKAEIERVSRGR
jgi:uncharacterized protein